MKASEESSGPRRESSNYKKTTEEKTSTRESSKQGLNWYNGLLDEMKIGLTVQEIRRMMTKSRIKAALPSVITLRSRRLSNKTKGTLAKLVMQGNRHG